MQNSIMVSVICNAYNHECFIRQTLEGFISQKTSFKYEVLIHDDASTDKTADIIREYEENYPDIIKPIYQTENQYSKKTGIMKTFQYPRVNGKYIALCEGDDFWIDENKLQKQVDFLESNPNCVMCCHNSKKINYQTGEEKIENPIEKSGYATAYDIITDKRTLWIATASLVFRAEIIETYPEWFNKLPIGDMPLRWYCFAIGDVYYFEDVMSIYNYKIPGSWSETGSSPGQLEKYLEYYKRYNEFTNYKYDDYIKVEIDKRRFRDAIEKKLYKEMNKPQYREYYKYVPLKDKLYIWLYQYIPFVLNIYSKIKIKLRKK